tara:strand:- start:1763 stop:2056 length:294 start_codon:yes stop_codon:yes gene_type:complete
VLGYEIAAFSLLLGLHWYLGTLAHRKLLQTALVQVSERISELDLSLGEAVELVQSRSPEGQNPLVGVLSQYLAQNLQANPIQAKVLKGDDGKFLKKE